MGPQGAAPRTVEPVQRASPQGRAHPGVPAVELEFDIWSYIGAEKIKLPSIYYAHQRKVFLRDGMYLAVHKYLQPRKDEQVIEKTVRFRTVGDVTCTGCVESAAASVEAVIAETAVSRLTERGATRADDRISEAGMEDRKREGYF